MPAVTIRVPAWTDGVSLAILVLLAYGVSQRRDREVHPKVMLTAFACDLGLVLYLELTRGAVERASQLASQLLTVHVAIAVTTLALNVALVISGWKMWRGTGGSRTWHYRLAWAFGVGRVATFLTAFLIPAR